MTMETKRAGQEDEEAGVQFCRPLRATRIKDNVHVTHEAVGVQIRLRALRQVSCSLS